MFNMTEVKMTKIEKAIDLLVNQRLKLTEGQLASRLGTTGVGARSLVNKVRSSGYTIYTNAGGFDKQGRQRKTSYRYGKPTRQMVSHYYAVFGAMARAA
jgi:predicted ArsR family transcriptional regulator